MSDDDGLRADLVLSGGGVRGVALAGAVAALTDAGYQPQRVSGTSAGGIVGSMVSAGLRGAELGELARSVDYLGFLDPAVLNWVPVLGANDGIYKGDAARRWLEEMLEGLGVRTFRQLRLEEPDPWLPPNQQYKLVVTCADLTLGQLVRLPWDYEAVYGLDPDEQSVADAVRASMSVPLLFRPATLPNHRLGRDCTLVDGGIVSNFPIDSLDRDDGRRPRWPTFGVTLVPDMEPDGSFLPSWLRPVVPTPITLLERVVITSLMGRDQAHLNQPSVRSRSITINSDAAGYFDFHADEEQIAQLYADGYQEGRAFLARWDWQEHLEARGADAARASGP